MNGKTLSLTETCAGNRVARRTPCSASDTPAITLAAILATRHAGRLDDERHRAAGARIDFEHVDIELAVFLS